MSATHNSKTNWFPILGIALLGIGLIVLFTQVDSATARLADRVGVSSGDLGGDVPAVVLTTVRTVQALAFDRPNVLSALREMLLSCWPVILVILGADLLRRAFDGFARLRHNGTASAQGEL